VRECDQFIIPNRIDRLPITFFSTCRYSEKLSSSLFLSDCYYTYVIFLKKRLKK